MSLFGSLFSGVSGLTVQSQRLGMISDNISNVNTVGYKAAEANFANLVTQHHTNTNYSPGGVRSFTTRAITGQGLVQATDNPTDAAIDGNGFFVVKDDVGAGASQYYTREGSFEPDYLGNLVSASGYYLQGWSLDANGEVVDINTIETVNTNVISGLATATTQVEVGANLNAEQAAYAGAPAYNAATATTNMAGGVIAPDFTRGIQIYDTLGKSQDLTMSFLKTGSLTWAVEVYATDSADVTSANGDGLIASGSITFNSDGSLASTPFAAPSPITWNTANGAGTSSVTFDIGELGSTGGITQFSSPNSVAFVLQNGAEVGELNGVSIDGNGQVVASFTNGETRSLYKLPLATFPNAAGLEALSGNVFTATEGSGEYNLRLSGEGGAGLITPAALEAANVDMANEFSKMIVTQRAYSANARIISTANDMLNELIQLNR